MLINAEKRNSEAVCQKRMEEACWFTEITRKHARIFAKLAPHVGKYLVLECTDQLDAGQIVSFSAIRRQLEAWSARAIPHLYGNQD
jgi:hypothetical protein